MAETDFSRRLQRLREREGTSRVVLSQLCGLPDTAIRRYERGEISPSIASLIAIADHFQVSIDYLVGRKNF
ncbi:MAG: helix-turn-helix transcriptional regulator [Oscillospiraceae bacterium]|nr:helix-turn-helix transcriptional regulator [Oscillospiraceae bacterium]